MALLQIGAPRCEAGLWLDRTGQLASPNMHLMKRICSAISPFASYRTCPLRIRCIACFIALDGRFRTGKRAEAEARTD